MVKRGGRANYKTINLPQELLDQVDGCVKKDPVFRSRAEFVKEAIKEKLLNIYSRFPDSVLIKEDNKSIWKTMSKREFFEGIQKKEFDNTNVEVVHFPEMLQSITTDLQKIDKLEKKVDSILVELKKK